MGCLDTLIGIKSGCGSIDAPDSGLWINDLPGISIAQVDHAINEEHESAYDLIETKITEAGNEIIRRIVMDMEPRFKNTSVLQNEVVGQWEDDLPADTLNSNYYYGIEIEVDVPLHLELFLSQLSLHASTSGSITVRLFDLISGTELTTWSITTVADVPTALDIYHSVKESKQPLRLFIGIDGASSMYKTTIDTGCCGNEYSISQFARSRGAKILKTAAKTSTNVESHNGTAGLSMIFSLNCDYEPFVCALRSKVAAALRFKVGMMILDEMIFSTRFNSTVIVYAEDYRELRDQFSIDYEAEMETVFQYMSQVALPDHVCFSCHPITMTRFNG